MSKKIQPKRRKVWVTFDRLSLCAVFSSRARATAHARVSRVRWAPDPDCYESVVAFVEVRPGDVVLSREDAEELRNIVRSPMLLTGNRNRALALLRGRR